MDKKDIFIKAVQENEGLIYKVATFYTNSKDDRADLVQEIIYTLWKSFETFKQQSTLSTWMYQVAMNVAIFHLRKSKRSVTTSPIDLAVFDFPETDSDDFEEKLKVLHNHIKELNLFDKGILMLYLESKSHEEIAEIIGISKTNVGTKLSRIKEKLKTKIIKAI
ncbi:MAG TPA: sigma-70 family RNA polymerase sigma factor [Niabella sp.]|nr:sigma-70 family RNA polymerase sigma factor [Niabella sp.]HUN01368.1 sigma-70 family RNA polymerase sigma factor [Niabella sp.]